MIRINKPAEAPVILQNRGVKATSLFREQYDLDPKAYKNWKFDSRIYGAKSVKNALRNAQYDKCAFCESTGKHIAYGDVEHFRPKAGYRQRPKDPLTRPGYYWLAYDWSNLLFCCQLCNQQFKRNHFPLLNVSQRAKSHHDDIKSEQPLLIHPAIEAPSLFLDFRQEYLYAIDNNPRGRVTIEVLGLNREGLAEVRRDYLKQIEFLIESRNLIARKIATDPDPELVSHLAAINAHLVECAADSAKYAAMVRAALR